MLAQEVVFLARLLAGEMPTDIERAFDQAGLSLFPAHRQPATSCSCPDPSNPCKHIAAVYYLLGEEFDRDPFLIFRLRGMPARSCCVSWSDGGDGAPDGPRGRRDSRRCRRAQRRRIHGTWPRRT